MSLSIGIVGLPNVGKSTLFNALTRAGALAANYPFATIEPNVGVVGVPDPRLEKLSELYDSARIVPASVRFTDIAGLVRGASEGQGMGNQFLGHIRETDAICQVVRVFADPDVTRVEGSDNPEDDISTVVTELILADLQTLEKAVPRLAKETKFSKDPERLEVAAAASAAVDVLDKGQTLFAGAAAAGISLRTGCFCNPGAGEHALGAHPGAAPRTSTMDDYLARIGLPTGGAVRVSLGIASTLGDVEAFLDFAERTYRDRFPDLEGLVPRTAC